MELTLIRGCSGSAHDLLPPNYHSRVATQTWTHLLTTSGPSVSRMPLLGQFKQKVATPSQCQSLTLEPLPMNARQCPAWRSKIVRMEKGEGNWNELRSAIAAL